jgi:hypothetical protein
MIQNILNVNKDVVIPQDNVKIARSTSNDFITGFNYENLTDNLGYGTIDRFAKYLSERGVSDKNWEDMVEGINKIDSLTPPKMNIPVEGDRIDYLNRVLNPEANDFKLLQYNKEIFSIRSMVVRSGMEVWTESECLMILPHLVENFYKEVQKLRIK